MYDSDFWSKIITAILNNLPWPIVVLIIVLIFKRQIKWLIVHIKSWKAFGNELTIDKDDKVSVHPPGDKVGVELELPSPPSEKALGARLSNEEIEQSRQRALKRIEEDIKKAGYQRGKLRPLENGGYAVVWDLQVSDGVIAGDSASAD